MTHNIKHYRSQWTVPCHRSSPQIGKTLKTQQEHPHIYCCDRDWWLNWKSSMVLTCKHYMSLYVWSCCCTQLRKLSRYVKLNASEGNLSFPFNTHHPPEPSLLWSPSLSRTHNHKLTTQAHVIVTMVTHSMWECTQHTHSPVLILPLSVHVALWLVRYETTIWRRDGGEEWAEILKQLCIKIELRIIQWHITSTRQPVESIRHFVCSFLCPTSITIQV